mmetsp:Transcript_31910/g.72242  ORF Transcript_31910/g.72242 Transcript_31910/m.72242 type:complete len:359 (-) Transcript_31910:166-1242(-)
MSEALVRPIIEPFHSLHSPTQMRQLALVAHNHMKPAMHDFIIQYGEVLRKFRVTGTETTMSICKREWKEKEGIVYGETCTSGPLGGDAEISSSLVRGDIGAVVFFIDPLSPHPHQADIDSLCRLCIVHDVPIMHNRSSAIPLMLMLKTALETPGMAERVIPSFFRTLESPAVADYKLKQAEMMSQHMKRRAFLSSDDGVQSSPARLGERGLSRDMLGRSMLLSSETINEIQEEVNSTNRGNPTTCLPLRDPLGNSIHCTNRNLLAGLEEVDTDRRASVTVPRSLRSSVATMESVEEAIEEDVLSSGEFEAKPESSSLVSSAALDTVSTVDPHRPTSSGRMPRAKRWFRRSFLLFLYKL